MKSKLLIILGAFLVFIAGCSRGNLTAEEKPLEGKWFCNGEDYPISWLFASDHRFGQGMQFRDPEPSNDTTWKVVDGELIIFHPPGRRANHFRPLFIRRQRQ